MVNSAFIETLADVFSKLLPISAWNENEVSNKRVFQKDAEKLRDPRDFSIP